MSEEQTKPSGRFTKGKSGNPKGRKPGMSDLGHLRASIAARVPEIIEVLMIQSLAGDVGASKLLLERAVAPLKATEATQAIQMQGSTLSDCGRAVLASVASGELAPSQGAALITAVGTLARVIEYDELTARITALEGKV